MKNFVSFLKFSLVALLSLNFGKPIYAMKLLAKSPKSSINSTSRFEEVLKGHFFAEWGATIDSFRELAATKSPNSKKKLDFLFEQVLSELKRADRAGLNPNSDLVDLDVFLRLFEALFNYSQIEKNLFEKEYLWLATYAIEVKTPLLLDHANQIEKKISETQGVKLKSLLSLRRNQIFFLNLVQQFGNSANQEIASTQLKAIRAITPNDRALIANAAQSLANPNLTPQNWVDIQNSIIETELKVGDRIGLLLYNELRKHPNSTQLAFLQVISSFGYLHLEGTRTLVTETLEEYGLTIFKKSDSTLPHKRTLIRSIIKLILNQVLSKKPVNDKLITLLHQMTHFEEENLLPNFKSNLETTEAHLFEYMSQFCFNFEIAEGCRILGLLALKNSKNQEANTCLKKAIELGSTSALDLYIDAVAENKPTLERQFVDQIINNSPAECLLTHGLKLTETDLNKHRTKLRALDAIQELGEILSQLKQSLRSTKNAQTLTLLKSGTKLSDQIQTEGLNTQVQTRAQNYSKALKKIRAQFTENQRHLYLALIQTKQKIEDLRKYEDPSLWSYFASRADTYAAQLVIEELDPQNEPVQSITSQIKELYAEHRKSMQQVESAQPYLDELYRDALIDLARLSIGMNGELPPDVPYIYDELIRGTPSPARSEISREKTLVPEPPSGSPSNRMRASSRFLAPHSESLSAITGRPPFDSSLEIPDAVDSIRPAHQAFIISPTFLKHLNELMTKSTSEDKIFLRKISSTLSKLKLWIENPSLQCAGLNLHKPECLFKHSNIWQAYLENNIPGARRLYFKRTDDNRILLLQARTHPKPNELKDGYFSKLLADSPVALTEELWKKLEEI